jgi:hypothetical protein
MVRVGISVLVPHLAQKDIFVTPISMGGNVSIDRVRYEINKLIYSFDVVTTFLLFSSPSTIATVLQQDVFYEENARVSVIC